MKNTSAPEVVGPGRAERVLVWAGFPVAGAGLLLLLASIAGWVAGLRWVPMRGPFEFVDELPDAAALAGGAAVGALLGLVVAFLAENEYVIVTVGDAGLALRRGGESRKVAKEAIGGVFLADRRLVVLGHAGEELAVYAAGEGADLPDAGRLGDALRARGYRWLSGDPYEDGYRRWVPDIPGLPTGGDALLRARARAIEKGDKEEMTRLRAELATIGVAVRDDRGKRQYWRVAGS